MAAGDSDDFLPPDLGALGAEVEAATEAGEDGRAAQILAQHRDGLMSRAGVVMVGETLDALGRAAIMIGVREQKNMARLPREVDGVPVVVQVVGDVEAQ